MRENMLGAYGRWAANLVSQRKPAALSFRSGRWPDLEAWRKEALARVRECIAQPKTGGAPKAKLERTVKHDGLVIEELSWQLPYGPRTEALFLRPARARGRLPGVLGLHDHGGNKFFGKDKITCTGPVIHPLMAEHQQVCYGGVAWANELAKRGYAVLVHDGFLFGSRRVRAADVPRSLKGDLRDPTADDPQGIQAYNRFAGEHEHIVAKSLFSAGTTWPGVFLSEDQRALDYLASRPEVDPDRLGCCGLSGGGLRTVFLGGLDHRIRAAVCVGFMSTWRDFLRHKCWTHTWMTYVPLLPRSLDFPEILGLRVPLPTLVLNDREDSLYTLPEMERADAILGEVFARAGAPERYRASFYPGPHKFDRPMQAEAFTWFDRWLKR
jgi:dienelactone hydrolase